MKANTDLLERLREKNGQGDNALGYHPLINPDGPEAADTIERLRAELAARVPEGYVVVPVEPTGAMLSPIVDEMAGNELSYDADEDCLTRVWNAMIAAAEGEE